MAEYPWLRRVEETEPAYSAFRVYLDMGPQDERNITEVARRLKKSTSLIQGWSSRHSWRERVAAFDNHLAAAETDGLVNQLAECRDKNLALIDKLRDLLDMRLDDFIKGRKDPSMLWTQALTAMAKIEQNSLLLSDRAQTSKTSEAVAKVEALMAELDERIQGAAE